MTAWNLLFQGVSVALALVAGLVMVPLYVRHIPLDLYGAWLASGNILAWAVLLDPGIAALVQQRCAQHFGAGQNEQVAETFTAGLLATSLLAAGLALTGAIFHSHLGAILNVESRIIEGGVGQAFLLALIGSVMTFVSHTTTAFGAGLQSRIAAGLIPSLAWAMSLALTAVLLMQGWGVVSLGWAAIAQGVFRIVGTSGYAWYRWRDLAVPIRFNTAGLRSFASLSGDTFLSRLTAQLFNSCEGFLFTRIVGPDAAASFLLIKRGPDVARMLLERPIAAALPAISSMAGDERARAAIVSIITRFLRLALWSHLLFVAAFVVLHRHFIGLWIGAQFWQGHIINGVIVLGASSAALCAMLHQLAYGLGAVSRSSRILFAIGLPTIVLGAVATSLLGPAGYVGCMVLVLLPCAVVFLFPVLLEAGNLDRGRLLRVLLSEVGPSLLSFACACGVGALLPASSWIAFTVAAATMSIVFVSALALLSRAARTELQALLRLVLGPVRVVSRSST